MKKTKPHTSAIAACTVELTSSSNRVQLLPVGEFAAKDGRPFDVPSGKWLLDASAAANVIAIAKSQNNRFVIDYEHQTLWSVDNGQPAPAAGWFMGSDLEFDEQVGLFACNVNWTDRASAFLKAREYLYISAVFAYDKKTGQPTHLLHAGLTNDPALDGMQAVAALSRHGAPHGKPNGEIQMNELLKKLLAKLGITVAEGDMADEAKWGDLVKQAEDAIDGLMTKADTATNEVAALKAKTPQTDLSKFVPIAVVDELRGQVAALKSGSETVHLDQLIITATQEGRLVKSEENWARDLVASQGIASLKQILATRPAVAALKGMQTHDTPPAKPNADGAVLTAEDLAVCKNFGLDPVEYKKSRSV